MFAKPSVIPSIPKETMRSAKAVFSPGNFYIQVGERLGDILDNILIDCLADAMGGSKAYSAILPLVIFFEFVEGLTDDQAAEAIRTRIDWKYALHLPVNPPAFHKYVLCEFRHKVVLDPANRDDFQKLVDRLLVLNPPLNNPEQDFEILPLLSGICLLNRLDRTWQAMQQALGALAVKRPDWLRQIMLPHWYGRFNTLSLGANPTRSARQNELSLEELGEDIHYLLQEVRRSNSCEISQMDEIKVLRLISERQFEKEGTTQLGQSRTSTWNDCDSCRYFAG